MNDVQCYELFGGIALKNYAFSLSFCVTNNIKGECNIYYKQVFCRFYDILLHLKYHSTYHHDN